MYFSYVLFENLRKCCLEFILGCVYTKRLRQRSDNSAMILTILFSLKTRKLLQIGVATHFQVTPWFSMRTVSLASSQGVHALCKRAVGWCDPTNYTKRFVLRYRQTFYSLFAHFRSK